jgi:predicted nucleotidyltransferase
MDLHPRDVELICKWAVRTWAVREVWLFGSRAKGISRPDSDVDVGIYLMPPASGSDWALATYTKVGDQWQRELAGLLERSVSLEAVTPGCAHEQKVRDGILLLTRLE